MKASAIGGVILAIVLTASGQLSESVATIDLRSVGFQVAHLSGSRLFLSVTGQPPEWEALLKLQPTPLKRQDPSELRRKAQVVYGRDVIGFALVSGVSRVNLPASTANKPRKMKFTNISLIFDAPAQAGRAAELLRLPELTPSPLNLQR